MPIYGASLTFKEPTAAQVPLNEQLVAVIKQHHQKSREHLFHLCMIAYGLRRHNLISNRGRRGGNVQGEELKPQFKAWYKKNNLDEVYGTEKNFLLYAMSGRLLSYIAWKVDRKYIDQLPSSVTGLYACSQILWTQGGTTTQERRDYFYKLLTKRTKDGSGVLTTSINKQSTRKEIEALHIERNQTSKAGGKKQTKIKEFVDLGSIQVSADLFQFTRPGTKRGHLKLEDVEKLHQEILSLIKNYDKGKRHYSFQSQLTEIKQKYEAEENYDYGASIKAAAQQRKKVVSKKSVKG